MRSKDITPKKSHPVKEDWQDVKSFGKEVGSGVADVGRGMVDMATSAAKDFVDPESYKRDWETVKRGAKFATDDPVGAAKYAARSTDDFVRAMANQATFGGADYLEAGRRKLMAPIFGDEEEKALWSKNKKEPWTGSYEQHKQVQDIESDEAEKRSPTATAMGDVAGTVASVPFTGGARAGVSVVAKGAQKLKKIPKAGKILKPAAEIGAGTVGGVAAEKGTGRAVRQIDPDNPYIPDQTNEGIRNPFRRAPAAPAPAPAPAAPHPAAPATPHPSTPVDLNTIPPSSSMTRRQWKRMSNADRQAAWDAHNAATAPVAEPEPSTARKVLDTTGKVLGGIKKGIIGTKDDPSLYRELLVKNPTTTIAGTAALGTGLYNWKKDPENRSIGFHLGDVSMEPAKGVWHAMGEPGSEIAKWAGKKEKEWFGDDPTDQQQNQQQSPPAPTPAPTEPGSSNVPGERLEPARNANRYTGNLVPEIPADASPQREAVGDNTAQDAENAAVAQFLRNMVRKESGGKNIQNTTGSKAYGIFQFMPDTFKGLVAKATPDSPLYKKTWNEFKQDVNLQKDAMKVITKEYLNSLHKSKLQVTPASLYMLHYFGSTGVKMMKSDPNMTLDKVFKPTKNELTGKLEPNIVFKQNPNLKQNQTISDLYGKLYTAMQDIPAKKTDGTRLASAPSKPASDSSTPTVQKGKKLKDKATDLLATVVGAKSASAEELPAKKAVSGGTTKPAKVSDKIDNKEKSVSDTPAPDTTVKAKSSPSDAEKKRRSQDMARSNADAIDASNKIQAAQKAHLAGTDVEKTPDELDRSKFGGTIGGKAYEPNPPPVPKITDVSKVLQKSYSNSEEPVSKPAVAELPPIEEPKSAWDKGIETITGKPRLSQQELRTVHVPESINTELQDILKLAGKR